MDIFGKPSSSTSRQKTSFQAELAAKMKDRKSRGLAADLTETEDEGASDSDDDLLSAFTTKSTNADRSQSPWRAEMGTTSRPQPPQPQMRSSTKDMTPQKKKVPIKPQNELDRLLGDDDESNLMKTQKKPWTPPQFKNFSQAENGRGQPQPKERMSKQSPLVGKPQSSIAEGDESDSDELASAYTQQLGKSGSLFGRQTPPSGQSLTGQQTPPGRQTPTDRQQMSSERRTPTDRQQFSTSRQTPTEIQQMSSGRQTPTERQQMSSGRQTPTESQQMSSGRQTPTERQQMSSGRQTPTDRQMLKDRQTPPTRQGSIAPKGRESPSQEKFQASKTGTSSRNVDDIFGGKSKASTSNMDDIFGKRKSPTDQNLFGSRSSSKENLADKNGRSPQANGRKTPQADPFGRKTPTQESFKRQDSFSKQASGGKESPGKQATMDDIFSGKKRAESPLFQSKKQVSRDEFPRNDPFGDRTPQPAARKGSYMSQLLADEGPSGSPTTPNTRTSYLDSLLDGGESEKTAGKDRPQTRTSYLDNLLDDKKEGERIARPRERTLKTDRPKDEEERESSVCRDVEKDPIMIETMKKEREKKQQLQRGKAKTDGQQTDFDIEEVADAQNSLAMTYIDSQKPPAENRHTQISKPKTRKVPGKPVTSPESSDISFESAEDIRKYIYKEWSEKKNMSAKQSLAEKKKAEKEEKLKKEKELTDKKLENEATFRTWKEQKDEQLRAALRKKRQEEKKKQEEEIKAQEKKMDASKIFQKWKENKDEEIIENKQKQKRGETMKLVDKQEVESRKKKEAEGAFKGWKAKKDKEIRQTSRQKLLMTKQESTQKMTESRRREIEAEELYEKWLLKKEEQKKREQRQNRLRRNSDYSPRPAWSPANKTIPQGR